MTNIEDVRAELLGTLKDLRNREAPMEPDRARAIAQVAGVLVDTARVEVEFIRATDGEGTGFIPDKATLPKPEKTPLLAPGEDHRRNRLR